jgi:hypothetical protein
MTETEFIMRDKRGSRVVDGVLVLAFLALFLGLVVLLSK